LIPPDVHVGHGLVILQTIWATIEDLLAGHPLTCSEFVEPGRSRGSTR
jgi:hypothetical protein